MVPVWVESSLAQRYCMVPENLLYMYVSKLIFFRRQMCGRAGRKGKDEVGETYLICGKSDLQAVCDLLDAEMPAIASCLTPEKRGLKR